MGSEGTNKQKSFLNKANDVQVDSSYEYCVKWLAAIAPTSQRSGTRCLSQQHPPESCADIFSSSNLSSYHSNQASPRYVTHHMLHHPAPAAMDSTAREDPVDFPEIIVHESPNATLYKGSKYEKQPRRKTRPDRYDTNRQRRSDQEAGGLSRRSRRERKREKLRSRREVMNKFYSSAVEARRVLMKPALATGAFVNGRGSISTPLADLTFNELTFPVVQRRPESRMQQQRSNGARTRSGSQSRVATIIPENSNPQETLLVVSSRPTTPTTPCQRPSRIRNKVYPDAICIQTDAAKIKHAQERVRTPLPDLKYVDSGFSPMGNTNLDHYPGIAVVEDAVQHLQFPTLVPPNNEHPDLLGHYNSIFPMAPTPSYASGYCTNDRPEPATLWPQPAMVSHETYLQVNPTPLPDPFTGYPEQLGYEHVQQLNFRSECVNHLQETDNAVDRYSELNSCQEGQEFSGLMYKPDEKAREFWRPNFLR